MNISLSPFVPENIWSCETVSAVPYRVSLLILHRLVLVLTYYGISPEFRGGVRFYLNHHIIHHRVSP